MANKRKYRSEISEAIHSAVEGMYSAGTIDKATMRRFDESCLVVPTPIEPRQIKKIRQSQHVSQPVFARYLNVTTGLISQWERAEKHPQGASLKLLTLVAKHDLDTVA